MRDAVFTDWKPEYAALWGQVPLKTRHRLHEHPLFGLDAIASLLESYPRSHYSLIEMGAPGERKLWREGELGGLSGREVLEWVAKGRIWINLRRIWEVDRRYRDLLEQSYAEIAERTGGEPMFDLTMGMLISSPRAQVYCHFDLLGQALWQIHGRKRIWLYPNHAPFMTEKDLEDVALFGVEVDMPFHGWFDSYAQVFDLEPGDMAHWPLNAPHRVENHDVLNVSITTEHLTRDIERRHRVNLANGVLRHRFGWTPRSRATTGPSYWAKAALQAAAKRGAWVAAKRAEKRPVEFRLDPSRPGGLLDLAAARA